MAASKPVCSSHRTSRLVERLRACRALSPAARALCLLLAGSTMFAALSADAADRPAAVTVFAAASMTDVLTKLGREYMASGGPTVRFSFAASSTLARQLEAGAPAHLFVSADNEWMDYAASRGVIDTGSRRVLIGNRLVLVAPGASAVVLHIVHGMDLASALGARGRLAIADPDSVPAGRYARSALVHLGVWKQVSGRLIRADNVRSALRFVARGEAPLAIVYMSDARVEPDVRTIGTFPANVHGPIVYPIALTRTPNPNARAFLEYLLAGQQRPTFLSYGFVAP